jgi:hypothetical protein
MTRSRATKMKGGDHHPEPEPILLNSKKTKMNPAASILPNSTDELTMALHLSEVVGGLIARVKCERTRSITAAIQAKSEEGVGLSINLIDPFGNCLLEACAVVINNVEEGKDPAVKLTHQDLRALLSDSLIREYLSDEFACMLAQAKDQNEGTKMVTDYVSMQLLF